ncbi:MAG: UDP-3-O-acyl-N-acetylglucosamine deacetylase, partial [Nitrospinota bacterium]
MAAEEGAVVVEVWREFAGPTGEETGELPWQERPIDPGLAAWADGLSGPWTCQRTVEKPVAVVGRSIITGERVTLTLRPAPPDHGIRFRRTDRPEEVAIPLAFRHLARSTNYLTLAFRLPPARLTGFFMRHAHHTALKFAEHLLLAVPEPKVSIFEHLLGVASLVVDNCLVEVDGPELPFLGYYEFFETFYRAGVASQEVPRRILRATTPFTTTGREGQRLTLRPAERLTVDYQVDFTQRCPAVGRQAHSLEVTAARFLQECAFARTLYLTSWQIFLTGIYRSINTSLDNLKIILAADRHRYLNAGPEGPRYLVDGHSTEVVRHKVGDLLGELLFLGGPVVGHLTV